ncbi:MAG: germination protein YpeB [Clostridiales bacterium]|nr:germination protein YpeB [Clostridiales bacterium]
MIAAVCTALAAIALLCGLLYKTRQSEQYYKRQVTNSYRHAFSELVSSVGDMDSTLQKCVVSGTGGMKSQAFAEVFGATKAAKQALSKLPRNVGSFEETSGFISQVGDYAFALSKKTVSGENPAEEDMENLKKLSETTNVLSGNLTELLADLNDGNLTLQDMREIEARASRSSDELTSDTFTSRIKAAEAEFPDTPTLIYDGPFSSHIAAMKPKMCEGQEEVTQEEAAKCAGEFFGAQDLSFDGERGGNLPAYMFSCPSDNGAMNIEVAKQGGFIINMYCSHVPEAATFSVEDAVKAAGKFVAEKITDPLTESYHIADGNSVTVNFAYAQDGVICYPDLIKVEVSQETGDVTGFEAQGFVMHHTERELKNPAVSREEAQGVVSDKLKILSHALAVIPTSGKNEVFCHEFKCESADGRHYIVYVNAETGNEERILILIEDENGALAL